MRRSSEPITPSEGGSDAGGKRRDGGRGRALRVLHAYVVLPHALEIVAVLAATAAFALAATGGGVGAAALVRLLLAMLGGQIAVGVVNEVVDAGFDARVKPTKPIPAGLVSVRGALLLGGVGLAAMVGFGAGFGAASLALLSLGTAFGIAYSLWFKRTLLSWLPYLGALPLLPIWVWTTLDAFDPRLLLLYPLGAFAVVGVHLAQALPDTATDRDGGLRTPSSLLGERRTIGACWLATLSAPLLASLAAPLLAEEPAAVWGAAAAAVVLVGLNAALYRLRPGLGVAVGFPCVAVASAVVALGWVLGVVR